MLPDKRGARRVSFERAVPANMMAIDGTWQRACTVKDVSDSGAKLIVGGPVLGLPFKEFFLVLSSTGLACRRCELAWVNGSEIGVAFMRHGHTKATKAMIAVSHPQ
ncbi:PilZ domain-containing protein [Bradyrhizobium hipponense]|uniref:PilZ domain-containing protein n=2 Tax=Bradyrhizobium hipponense TaxID=2605638 RepID=A0A5S4YK09_9BRAD|nr:PilZ domain-containing protein [Bradyrhizobium hipponense]TYO64342.1 PilZ domain-containing protein [Bradyrhizobium hipponense]